MSVADLLLFVTVFVLAVFVGYEVITKVPPTLHTPLMSGSNAISGITILGSLVIAGRGGTTLGRTRAGDRKRGRRIRRHRPHARHVQAAR